MALSSPKDPRKENSKGLIEWGRGGEGKHCNPLAGPEMTNSTSNMKEHNCSTRALHHMPVTTKHQSSHFVNPQPGRDLHLRCDAFTHLWWQQTRRWDWPHFTWVLHLEKLVELPLLDHPSGGNRAPVSHRYSLKPQPYSLCMNINDHRGLIANFECLILVGFSVKSTTT